MEEEHIKTTTDHEKIKRWVTERGGRPAIVKHSKEDPGGGKLRIDFREREAIFEDISWEEFFSRFDLQGLTFLHQEEVADGVQTRFFKFVENKDEEGDEEGETEEKKKKNDEDPSEETK